MNQIPYIGWRTDFGSDLSHPKKPEESRADTNEAGARHIFEDIQEQSHNTIRRKRADLALFETFLNSVNVPAAGLYDHPEAWRGVTWGIVKAFAAWQLKQGYAVTSINGRLSTVRTYAKLAAQAGTITAEESILIASVKGYDGKEARHIDNQRRADGIATRTGAKKAEAIFIPADIAEALKTQPDTPQGIVTALMCLLLKTVPWKIAILTRRPRLEGAR